MYLSSLRYLYTGVRSPSGDRTVTVRNFVINGNERNPLHEIGWASGHRTAGPYGEAYRRQEQFGPYDFGRRRRSQQMTAREILTAAPSRVRKNRMRRRIQKETPNEPGFLQLMIEGYWFHAISLGYHTAHGERRQIGCPCKCMSENRTVFGRPVYSGRRSDAV